MLTPPAIILVHPQLGENIGAAARVMANFSLTDLRLVEPRDGWPNEAAQAMSAGALPDQVAVRLFDTVESAVSDRTYVIATTARQRGMEKPVFTTRHAVDQLAQAGAASAVMFGAEKSGLPNEAVALADAILSFPVNASFSSLNLAQSVAVLAHAWGSAAVGAGPVAEGGLDTAAPREALVGMMEHFEEELERAGFFFPSDKKSVMIQNLRNAFTRAGWTAQEVRTFRGAIKALAIGRGKARIVRED